VAIITIGMPVYNGAATLRAALDSLQAQTVQDFKLIISDNGSTDETGEICAEYARLDERISYIRQATNLGAAMNFRFVLMEAHTPYFMWAAADDLWAPVFIERHLTALEDRPDCILSQSRVLFTVDGRPSHKSTGTFPLLGTARENAAQYFTNPADNSRYYGVFRTEVLQKVFPIRSFFGIDWAVAGSTTSYGKHLELPDVLMVRDSSDPQVYANLVAREHRFWLWRMFPFLPLTIHIVRAGHVRFSPRLVAILFHLNLYMHFRFGLYRFQRLADEYLKTNSVRGVALNFVAKSVNYLTLPGIRHRIKASVRGGLRRIVRVLEQVGRKIWLVLPLSLERRFRLKQGLFRLSPGTFERLQSFSNWKSHPDATRPAAEAKTVLSEGPWSRLDAVPADKTPDFSIIVIAGPTLTTLGVIHSIVSDLSPFTAEVTVIDIGAKDVSPIAFSGRDDVTYCPFPPGTSPVLAAQQALHKMRGNNVVILERGLSVRPGFFEAIAKGLAVNGALAAKVVSKNGDVQSMGGRFARHLPESAITLKTPGSDASNLSSKRVDFSLRVLIARASLLATAGGLNVEYKSLHGAFADFGAQMQKWNERYFYMPQAAVVENTPPLEQDREAERRDDWMRFVTTHPAEIDKSELSFDKNRHKSPILLYVDADTPTPDQNAGSIEALNLMRIFFDLGYELMFVPESNFIHRGKYTDHLLLLGIDAVWYPRYSSIEEILRELGERIETVVLCRAYIAEKYIDLVRTFAPSAKIVFNMVDVHFMRLEREAALTSNKALAIEAADMKKSEYASIAKSDATIVVSSFEQQLLSKEIPGAKVHLIPLVREVPKELDVPGFDARADMMFVGTYQHPPNVDAVVFFAKEVWPLVRARVPDARFLIVGSQVTPVVEKLAGAGIEVLGFVEDLDPLMARCRLSVAPLRFGAGIKGKVGTALQAGLPTVATTIAVEGTPIIPGEHVLVADTPEDFAEAVVRAYTDPALWNALSKAGFQFVKDDYSFETNIRRITTLLEDVGASPDVKIPDAEGGHFTPSAFWRDMQARNALAIEGGKLKNFKRTINNNYFQWLPGDFTDPQVANLMDFWKERPSFWPISAVAETSNELDPSDVVSFEGGNPFNRPGYLSFYAFFTALRWYHAACHDPHRYHENLEEPVVGNPIRVRLQGKLISQDLANSLDEWCAVERLTMNFDAERPARVLEIGAGYGRLAYVALSTRNVRYMIVDIQPALSTAAWYLQQTLPEKTIFGPENFTDFESVRERLESADIVFLDPSQIELIPDDFINISVSISSLHEMRPDQVDFYVKQIDRLTRETVYLKQWRHWHNKKDDVVIERESYALPPRWKLVLDRTHTVMSEFIELGFVREPLPPHAEAHGVLSRRRSRSE
jgi:putative sugar O-methyltransferase